MLKAIIIASIFLFIPRLSCTLREPVAQVSPNELIGKTCDNPRFAELKMSNQSTSIEVVDIAVSIDGRLIAKGDFACRGQHNWYYFYFKMCPGKHTISAVSKSGEASIQTSFEFTENTEFIDLDYWYYDKKHYDPTPRHFGFEIFDKQNCELARPEFYVGRCKDVQKIEAEDRKDRILRQLRDFETRQANK